MLSDVRVDGGTERLVRRFSVAASALLLLAIAAFYATYVFPHLYHADTVAHLAAARGLLSDLRGAWFASRRGNGWIYMPAVALLGEEGLRWTNVVVIVAFSWAYLVVLQREFGWAEAWASTLLLVAAPATVITVTHLKEDYNALLFLALSLAVLRRGAGYRRAFVAGALYGAAVVCKEIAIFIAPFLVLHLWLGQAQPAAWRDLLRAVRWRSAICVAIAFLGGAVAVVFAVSPDYFGVIATATRGPYSSQFWGPVSVLLGPNWRMWREGVLHLHPWEALAIVAVAAAIWRADLRLMLWAATAAVLLDFLLNYNATLPRHFGPVLFFLLPVVARGFRIVVAAALRWAGAGGLASHGGAATIAAAAAVALAAWQVAEVSPTLAYRLAYPPQKSFFEGLGRELPRDAVLYGKDSCSLATYYANLPCREAPADPDEKNAAPFADQLVAEARRRPVFLLPDFLSYDAQHTLGGAVIGRAKLSTAYSALGEDFHAVAYLHPWDVITSEFERSNAGCRSVGMSFLPLADSPAAGFQTAVLRYACPTGAVDSTLVAYRGAPTYLSRLEVLRAEPL